MQEKRNLVVFDIDGTLTDSVGTHQAGFIAALKKMGVAEMDENFHAYKHHTDLHIARTIYESALQKHFDPAALALFEDNLYQGIALAGAMQEIPGARQFVDFLEKETSFGVCYATGSMYKPAQFKLEQIGIGFDALQLVASNHSEERAAIVQAAIAKAQQYYRTTRFERIIAFGDGLWDLHTAQLLHLEFVGVGAKNKTVLEAAGMQTHLEHYLAFDPSMLN